jgi:peptidoglycan/xylan/chitin deacetylase (PgdA/CDA1 family)
VFSADFPRRDTILKSFVVKGLSSVIPDFYRPPAGALLPFLHIVGDAAPPHVRHLYTIPSIAKFKSDLEFLCRQCRPLQISELEQLSLRRDQKPCARTFLLSFDDGMREVYDIIVPMLRQQGIPAIFFLNSATIDNRQLMWRHKVSLIIDRCRQQPRRIPSEMSIGRGESLGAKLKALRFTGAHIIDDIARLLEVDFEDYLRRERPYLTTDQVLKIFNDGFGIGAHSHSHPHFHELALQDQKKQISMSVKFIRALGLPCRYFSFPFRDTGVPTAVFSYMRELDLVLSFGASEARVDSIPFSFQRFRIDGPHANSTIPEILKQLTIKSVAHRLSRTEIIWRTPYIDESHKLFEPRG